MVDLEKEAFSLCETVKRVEEELRGRGRLLAEATRRATAAGKEAAVLKERLREAKEASAEKVDISASCYMYRYGIY